MFLPWRYTMKEVPSVLQPGESTATSEEDTKKALYEGRDEVSNSNGDNPRSIKMHLWCYGGSPWQTPRINLPYTTIRQMSKAWILYYYWQTNQHEPLLQTPIGFSCNNCCQRNIWQTMERPQRGLNKYWCWYSSEFQKHQRERAGYSNIYTEMYC